MNGAHGVAIDGKLRRGYANIGHRRLFSGCANENMLVVDADQGKIVVNLPIGRGSDAIALNDRQQQVFSSNGFGTVSVYLEKTPDI